MTCDFGPRPAGSPKVGPGPGLSPGPGPTFLSLPPRACDLLEAESRRYCGAQPGQGVMGPRRLLKSEAPATGKHWAAR